MLGRRSFSRILIVAIITKDTYPLRDWTLVCGIGYSLGDLLINISDSISEESCQETVRVLRTFSEQLPKATVPRRLALECSKGLHLPHSHELV
jgi:hypothetical protein